MSVLQGSTSLFDLLPLVSKSLSCTSITWILWEFKKGAFA